MAFTSAPTSKKALASAVNLFALLGIPSVVCVFLYRACADWFHDDSGRSNIDTLPRYVQAHVYKYFLLLIGIALFGVLLNLLPPVRNWVQNIEARAARAVHHGPNKRDDIIVHTTSLKDTETTNEEEAEGKVLLQTDHQLITTEYGTTILFPNTSSTLLASSS
eukprot:CAMPEP_0116825370 /NCGR_PEP_ID=MMETSP0418-20121206/1925_1 /TAXON_ID=1158023 /ORGANISM="Astrosyne radiata, Strain 13vi08-1A" /LENGTH=162 /DNA_ID=CAMNT_0004453865 /DNA_START=1 /DNA_END=489 /DNA_ORIENTATION=-